MQQLSHVSFYEEVLIEHNLTPFLASGVVITDFAMTPWGGYLLGLSDGSLLLGQRESNTIEWSLIEVFTVTLQKILVGPTHIFIIGIDESVQSRSRFGGVFSIQHSSGQSRAGFFLAVFAHSQNRRRHSSGASTALVLRQKIPSSLSMAITGTVVTTMSVTEDEHYLILGTNKGQLEVIRLNRNKSLYVTEITGTTLQGKKDTGSRIPIQSVFIVPSTEGTRLAWVFGSGLATISSTLDADNSPSYIGLYGFNGYGSHLHSLARLVSPQPTHSSATLCDYNSSFPGLSSKNAIGTVTYFNYTSSLQIVEVLTPCSLSNLTLNNPNDIAKVDTVIRAPHPLLYTTLQSPLVSLQRNSINHLMTLELSGALTIYDATKLVYKASIPQAEYKVVVSPVTNAFVCLATSPSQNFSIREINLLSDHAQIRSLINNKLYTEALAMAKSSNCSLTSFNIATIHMQFADFLFEQGQLEQSIEEYSQTSKLLEPCVVLSKFLAKNRVDLMVRYILSINRAGKADDKHIRMLFNFYERLGHREAIHDFIEEAIQVYHNTNCQQCTIKNIKGAYDALRDMGMVDEALLLSICLGEGLLAINLLIETSRYIEVLCLLSVMDFDDCRAAVLEFGRELIKHSPQDICKTIKRLCVMFSSEQPANLPVRYRQAVLLATKEEPKEIPAWITRMSKWNRPIVTTDQVFSIEEFMFIFSEASLNSNLLDILTSLFARVLDNTLGYDSFKPATAVVFFELQLCLKVSEAEILKNLKDYIRLINTIIDNTGSALISRLKSPDVAPNQATAKSSGRASGKEKTVKKQKKLKLEIRDGLSRILVCFYLHDFKAGILRLLQMNLDHISCIRFYISTGDLYSAGEAYGRMLDDREFISDASFERDIWMELLTACISTKNVEATADVLRTIMERKEVPYEQVLQVIATALPLAHAPLQADTKSDYYFELDEFTATAPGLSKEDSDMVFGPFADYFLEIGKKASACLCECVETMIKDQTQLQVQEERLADITKPRQWTKGTCARCNFRLEPPITYLGCGHAFHSNCLQAQESCPHCYPEGHQGAAPVAKTASGCAKTFTGLVEELLCPEVAQFFP